MKVTPLYLNALGRSGTTLLMRVMGAFDNVAFVDTFPYEVRIASFLACAYKVLTGESGNEDPWAFERDADNNLLSAFPYLGDEVARRWYLDEHKPLIRSALKASLEALAIKLVRRKGYLGEDVWWVEKFPHNHEAEIANIFGPFDLLTIIRNPMEVARSQLRLDLDGNHPLWKRQTSFADIGDTVNLIVKKTNGLLTAAESFGRRNKSSRSIIVRYEEFENNSTYLVNALLKAFPFRQSQERLASLAEDLEILAKKHRSESFAKENFGSDTAIDADHIRELMSEESLGLMKKLGYD